MQKKKRFESVISNLAILVLLLKKACDQNGKRKYIQMEVLSGYTKHPRDNKASNPPGPPSTTKRTEISSIKFGK